MQPSGGWASLDRELGRAPLAGTTTGHRRQILKVDLGDIPSGGITLRTRPHDSALGQVAGLAPPSVRVNRSSRRTGLLRTSTRHQPWVPKEPKTLVPGAPGPHCRDMSRAVRPARSRRVTWKDRRVSWRTARRSPRKRWRRRPVPCWCGAAGRPRPTRPSPTRMLRWWGRGWESTALSMSARSAPAWSCPITGPAGATTAERTSGPAAHAAVAGHRGGVHAFDLGGVFPVAQLAELEVGRAAARRSGALPAEEDVADGLH